MKIKIADIRLDGGTQPRAMLDETAINNYCEDIENGATMPSVEVCYDGTDYWLWDGFHRVHANKKAGNETIEANVSQGTRRDAVLKSVGVNSDHGLRRTNADKRQSVMTLLEDNEWQQWSDREIARRCKVSHTFVNSLRGSLSTVDSERIYTTKHGTVSTMQTKKIGSTPPVKPALPDQVEPYLQDAVEIGKASVERAIQVTETLETVASEPVREASVKHEIKDPQLITLLEENKSNEVVQEVIKTGKIEYAENDERNRDLSDASAWDFQGLLKHKQRERKAENARKKQEEKNSAIVQLPTDIYSIVYADPPWQYNNSGLHGSVTDHYPPMDLEDICSLPERMGLKVADSAMLFLWATNPLLIEAFQVMEAWGFEYKTNIAWDKVKPTTGLGFYVHGQHELLLIGIRGDYWKPTIKPDSLVREEKGKHSAKPESIRELIETMYPEQRYIELFARNHPPRKNWTFWGNQENEQTSVA